ncbi:MAG: SH3 domain-containing protein [Spirochaetota bacterium]
MVRTIAVLVFILLSAALFATSVGDDLAVSVRQGDLRSAPGFLSRIDARLPYGASVTVLGVQGDWTRVRVESTGEEGWVHATSVLPPRDLNLADADSRESGASSDEIALAGRGFSEQVEREYEEQESLDFGPVDEMEDLLLPVSELGDFLGAVGADIAAEAEE